MVALAGNGAASSEAVGCPRRNGPAAKRRQQRERATAKQVGWLWPKQAPLSPYTAAARSPVGHTLPGGALWREFDNLRSEVALLRALVATLSARWSSHADGAFVLAAAGGAEQPRVSMCTAGHEATHPTESEPSSAVRTSAAGPSLEEMKAGYTAKFGMEVDAEDSESEASLPEAEDPARPDSVDPEQAIRITSEREPVADAIMADAGGGEEKGLPTGPTCAADDRKCAVSEAARPADNPVDDIYEAAPAQGKCVVCLYRARDGYGFFCAQCRQRADAEAAGVT